MLPIYVTEFGVFDSQSPAMLAASEWVMAQPYIRSFAQYTLSDDWFEAGLVRTDGSPKPSLSVFADPIFVRRLGTRVQIWGHLRTLPHRTSVFVFDRGRLAGEAPVVANAGGYFSVGGAWKPGRRWALSGACRRAPIGSSPPQASHRGCDSRCAPRGTATRRRNPPIPSGVMTARGGTER